MKALEVEKICIVENIYCLSNKIENKIDFNLLRLNLTSKVCYSALVHIL